MVQSYKCALFDLDNTLLKKSPHVVEKVYEYVSVISSSISEEEVRKAYAESELWTGEQIMDETEKGYQMPDDEFKKYILQIYNRKLNLPAMYIDGLGDVLFCDGASKYELNRDAKAVLDELKQRNVLMGIVSNNHSRIRESIERLNLTGYFSAIVLSDEVKLWKPDPQIMLYALSHMKINACEALYVGDHPFDILCARNAGMDIAWYQPKRLYDELPAYIGAPDYTISGFLELLGIL